MIFASLLLTNLLLASASLDGFCDKEQNCMDNKDDLGYQQKLLFYDVNPSEGFNLRRDVYMRFAIMLAEARKNGKKTEWSLILPPWYNLYHWQYQSPAPSPWSYYFDLLSLQSYAPVLELYDVFPAVSKPKQLNYEIDIMYVLQNYKDAFENGVFEEKWEIEGPCEYEGFFWGYNNITVKEVICVKFQGKISQLWDLMATHPSAKKVMISHGEIPLHDTYGTMAFWDCRISMRFNSLLVSVAEVYISAHLKCNTRKCPNYVSVHWRRQDFVRYRKTDIPTVAGTARQIDTAVRKHQLRTSKVFIATDALDNEKIELENELYKYGHKAYFYAPNEEHLEEFNEGQTAIIEQIICSRSAYFIGTHESTFTYRIQEEREIMGFDSLTTFNRFCPAVGPCEEPSKWTIVN